MLHPNTLHLCTLHHPLTSKAINLPQYRGKGKYLEKDWAPINLYEEREGEHDTTSSSAAARSPSSPTSWRPEEALGGHRNCWGREKEVCGNTGDQDDRIKKNSKNGNLPRLRDTLSQTKTLSNAQKEVSLTHSTATVVGLLCSDFDLLLLSVPLEWDSRILASIYVLLSFENNMAFSNKERNAAVTGQGWEVTVRVN